MHCSSTLASATAAPTLDAVALAPSTANGPPAVLYAPKWAPPALPASCGALPPGLAPDIDAASRMPISSRGAFLLVSPAPAAQKEQPRHLHIVQCDSLCSNWHQLWHCSSSTSSAMPEEHLQKAQARHLHSEQCVALYCGAQKLSQSNCAASHVPTSLLPTLRVASAPPAEVLGSVGVAVPAEVHQPHPEHAHQSQCELAKATEHHPKQLAVALSPARPVGGQGAPAASEVARAARARSKMDSKVRRRAGMTIRRAEHVVAARDVPAVRLRGKLSKNFLSPGQPECMPRHRGPLPPLAEPRFDG